MGPSVSNMPTAHLWHIKTNVVTTEENNDRFSCKRYYSGCTLINRRRYLPANVPIDVATQL